MVVFITGVTGLLGGELLVNISSRPDIKRIYCLVRASNAEAAVSRLQKVFDLHDSYYDKGKIIPVIGDLYDDGLTDLLIKNKNLSAVTIIIHSAANTCFSRIYDKQVEMVNVNGLEKILLWARKLARLETFLYIGTATMCGKDIRNRVIFEDESPNPKANHLVKYTYTKMLGEMMLHQHLGEEKILVARPSIIMGDSRNIKPRSPVILWAVATINQLRFIPVNEKSLLDVISVDYASKAIIKLLFAQRSHQVYHISSGQSSATSVQMLAGCLASNFNELPPYLFAKKELLNQVKLWAKGELKHESELYQYTSYLEYWEQLFKDKNKLRIILAGLEPYTEFIELGQVFDNSRLLATIDIHAPVPAHQYISNSIEFIREINVLEGALDA